MYGACVFFGLTRNYNSICGAVVGVLAGSFVLNKLIQANRVGKKLGLTMKIQLFVIVISVAFVYSTSSSLQKRAGLPVFNQVASWIIIGNVFIRWLY
jgi:phosphatidylinositol glycan class N